MPVDGTLIFDTEIDRSGIEKGSKLAKSDLEKLGTQVKDIFSSKNLTSGLADLGGKLVGAFAFAKLTQGLGQVATAAIKYNAQMEAYQTNFSVMLGDEAKGVEYVAQLREKAAKTPFGMEDLASAAQTMLSFGMDAENANTAMDRLGDIALGNKDKFQSLSLAFSQISAAGKLTGEDLLQMVNAGFNPLNTLAEKTGTSLGDLKDVMSGGKGSAAFRKQMKDAQNEVKKLGAGASEGAKLLAQIGQEGMISAEMVGKAMEIETSPGGRFYDGMENASKTMEGQFSTLKDNSMQLVGNIFSPISDALSGVILPAANGVIDALNGLFEDKSFVVEAKAEVEAAKNDLQMLDGDVQALKEKFLREQITVNLNAESAKEIAGELQEMFVVTPRLKDWPEEDKEKAFALIDELNKLFPDFEYTPDEEGLAQLKEDLGAEGEAVDALIEKYEDLAKKRNLDSFVGGLKGQLTDAQTNALFLAQKKSEFEGDKEMSDRYAQAYEYLVQKSLMGPDATWNGAAGELYKLVSGASIGTNDLTDIDTDTISGILDIFGAFSELGGNLGDLEQMDPEGIDLSKLVDAAGNLKGSEEIVGDPEAIMSLYNALIALSDASQEKAEEESEKRKAFEAEIASIQTQLDAALETVAGLQKDVTTGETMQQRLEEGMTYQEMMENITSDPYVVTVESDDQATGTIDNVRQSLDNLDGKTANTSIRVTVTKILDGDVDGSHASGLDRVPFNGYIARLHEGEAVLTRSEASLWRAGKTAAQGGGGMLGDAGASFQQVNNFNVPVQTPDEFAKTMRLYATYGLEGVI